MHLRSFLCILTLPMLLSSACEAPATDNDVPVELPSGSSITVTPDPVTADPEGGMTNFRLTAADSWTAQADRDWVIISPSSGSKADKRKIDVIVEANGTGAERYAELTIFSGDDSRTVKLVQGPQEVITEFSADVESLTLEASGLTTAVITVKSPAAFEVSHNAGWLNVTSENGAQLKGRQDATRGFRVAVSAQANLDGADRSMEIVFAVEGKGEYRIPVKQTSETFVKGEAGLPAVWLLNDSKTTDMRQTFMGPAYVQASGGSSATLSIYREAVNQQKDVLDYNVASDGGLEMRMLGENDYILYNVPVKDLPAGTTVHIVASYHSDNSANKYFVFECFDAGEWKMADGLKTSPEGVLYHYESNGLGLSQAYTPVIDETVTLSEAVADGSIRMRLRCVGNRNYSGSALDFSSNALTRIAAAKTHGTSPIVRLLDGPRPDRAVKVLFVGNSYTYYNWSSYMLKEIAWKEGLEVDVVLSAHSGFTIEKHLEHKMTKAAVAKGGFDYAILQEYNDRVAVIGADLAKGSLGTDAAGYVDNMKALVASVTEVSPSCRTYVEMSWGTKTGTGSLIKTNWGDYAQMQEYVTSGTEYMKSASGAEMTLLGAAWKKVREEKPELEMYHTDNHHPSYAGSYLKACVNYLTLTGRPFGTDPCNCLLDPETAAYLRSVAESVVLR